MKHKLPIITATAVATVLAFAPLVALAEGQSQGMAQQGQQNDASTLHQQMQQQAQEAHQYFGNHSQSDERAIENAFENFAQHLTGSNDAMIINGRPTVRALLGQEVLNTTNVEIAELEDLLFNKDGQIEKVVLEGGGLLGIGDSLVSIDYDLVSFNNDGDYLVAPVSESMMERMEPFSYDQTQTEEPMLLSAAHLVQGKIFNANNERIASVENLTISADGEIEKIIGLYGDTMGVGGSSFSVDLDHVQLGTQSNQVINVRFNPQLTEVFETFQQDNREAG